MSSEERRRLLGEKFGGMLTEMESWYVDGLQQATVEEIKALLMPAAEVLPMVM